MTGQEGLPVHDTVEKTWRRLNFFQYKCFIHLRTPRTICPDCGEHLFIPAWVRKDSGFTLLFELLILTLAKEIPVSQIAALIGEHDTKVWRVIGSYVNKIYKGQDYHTVQKLGVDETSTRKGHNYVTVSADLETGHVLFATQGKGSTTIETFTNELPEHHAASAQIIEISMDMSPSFIFGVANHLPAASITFDKFHVIKQLNEALDEVRRNEQMKNPLLKGSRYSWLKTRKTLRQRNVKHCKL